MSLHFPGLFRKQASAPFLCQQRFKTYRKTETKAFKKVKLRLEFLKSQNLPIPPAPSNVLENKFWKVENGMKVYKPVTPGLRNRRQTTRFHLSKLPCIRRLSFGKRSTGGRNHTGKITVRHRGGGHKKRMRIIDWHRNTPGPHQIIRLEYDPNRTSDICLIRNLSTNEFSYVLHLQDQKAGDIIHSYRQFVPNIPKNQLIQRGNMLRLRDIPIGTIICNISMRPDGPSQICRSAGSSASLIGLDTEKGFAQVRLSSKEVRLFDIDCVAVIGVVGNENHKHEKIGKAGGSRRRGIRPTVRGIAMSACNHPHGGGHSGKGNKHPRTPWGWLTKGWKTVRRKKWYVVTPRWKAKK